MIDIKKFIKAIRILNSLDLTKAFEITVDDSATTNTKTTLVSSQTEDRIIELPDVSGTLLVIPNLDPLTVVTTDASGNLSTESNISTTELQSLEGITSNVQDQLDDKANTNLSNLVAPTAINENLLPANSAINVGNVDNKFGTVFSNAFQGTILRTDNNFTGAGVSPDLNVSTGNTNTSLSGDINIFSGTSSGLRGDINLTGGDLNIESSDVNIISASNEIDVNGAKIVNLVDPTNPQDAATKEYVDTHGGGGGGANTTLSNLTSPTAINQNLLPSGTITVGTPPTPFSGVYTQNLGIMNTTGSVPDFEISTFGLGLSTFISTRTKNSVDANPTGSMTIRTGTNSAGTGGSGTVSVTTGSTVGFTTGSISLRTGDKLNSNVGSTGTLSLVTGDVQTGPGDSGSIFISTGTSDAGTRGAILVDASYMSVSSINITDVADPVNAQDAATKAYVDSQIGGGPFIGAKSYSDSTATVTGSENAVPFNNTVYSYGGLGISAGTFIIPAGTDELYQVDVCVTLQVSSGNFDILLALMRGIVTMSVLDQKAGTLPGSTIYTIRGSTIVQSTGSNQTMYVALSVSGTSTFAYNGGTTSTYLTVTKIK